MTVRLTVPAAPDAAAREVAIAHLWAAGAQGVWERADELVAWFDRTTDAVPPGGTWEDEPEQDWQERWKAGIEPVVAGGVAVVPSWLMDQAPAAAHVIELDPGQAFGTGHHATTVLCLELLQELDLHDRRVLDVGTGTGVLAIAAAKLGAKGVRGVDIDPDAVRVARENAAANDVDGSFEVGSAGPGDTGYDVVVANLLTDTVTRLAPSLVSTVAPGGTLIVSGITVERVQGPRSALQASGATVRGERHRDGWVGLTLDAPR